MSWYKTQELISHVYEELEKGRKEHTPFFFNKMENLSRHEMILNMHNQKLRSNWNRSGRGMVCRLDEKLPLIITTTSNIIKHLLWPRFGT